MRHVYMVLVTIVKYLHSQLKLPPVIPFFFQSKIFHNFCNDYYQLFEPPLFCTLTKIYIWWQCFFAFLCLCSYFINYAYLVLILWRINILNVINSAFVIYQINLLYFSCLLLFTSSNFLLFFASKSRWTGQNFQNGYAKWYLLDSESLFCEGQNFVKNNALTSNYLHLIYDIFCIHLHVYTYIQLVLIESKSSYVKQKLVWIQFDIIIIIQSCNLLCFFSWIKFIWF